MSWFAVLTAHALHEVQDHLPGESDLPVDPFSLPYQHSITKKASTCCLGTDFLQEIIWASLYQFSIPPENIQDKLVVSLVGDLHAFNKSRVTQLHMKLVLSAKHEGIHHHPVTAC